MTRAPRLPASLRHVQVALLDAILGTERGTVARSEVRAEINELVGGGGRDAWIGGQWAVGSSQDRNLYRDMARWWCSRVLERALGIRTMASCPRRVQLPR